MFRNNSKADIYVALPIRRYKEPEFEDSLDHLFAENPYYTVKPSNFDLRRNSPNLFIQRYDMAMKFLKSNCSHYLYIDSDQVLGKDTIEKLVRAHVDIISPIIVKKVFPHMPACISFKRKKLIDSGDPAGLYIEDFRGYDMQVVEVYASCGGLVLIDRKVIQAIVDAGERPFYPEKNAAGDLMSVDYSFYEQARRAGKRCFVHTTAYCGHLGWYAFEAANYYGILDQGLTVKQMPDGAYEYTMGDK